MSMMIQQLLFAKNESKQPISILLPRLGVYGACRINTYYDTNGKHVRKIYCFILKSCIEKFTRSVSRHFTFYRVPKIRHVRGKKDTAVLSLHRAKTATV